MLSISEFISEFARDYSVVYFEDYQGRADGVLVSEIKKDICLVRNTEVKGE